MLKRLIVFIFSHLRLQVFFDISIGGTKAGTIVMGLYGNALPKTTENFYELSKRVKGKG